jgi:hypothetical protein
MAATPLGLWNCLIALSQGSEGGNPGKGPARTPCNRNAVAALVNVNGREWPQPRLGCGIVLSSFPRVAADGNPGSVTQPRCGFDG